MSQEQPKNALHGVTLKAILEDLVERRGWDDLADRIRIRWFAVDPSLHSSLKFLRRTDWARTKLERLYLDDQRAGERRRKQNTRRAAQRAFRAEQAQEPADSGEMAGALPDSGADPGGDDPGISDAGAEDAGATEAGVDEKPTP